MMLDDRERRLSRLSAILILVGMLGVEGAWGQEEKAELVERTWKVPADFVALLMDIETEKDGKEDPFNRPAFGSISDKFYGPVKQWLCIREIKFPDGATAELDKNKGELVVRNTPKNLAAVEKLITSMQPMKMFVLDPNLFRPLSKTESELEKVPVEVIARIEGKLDRIIIPVHDLAEIGFEEAIARMEQRSREFDTGEPVEARRGIRIRLFRPTVPLVGTYPEVDQKAFWKHELKALEEKKTPLEMASLDTAIDVACEQAQARFVVNQEGVIVLPYYHAAPEELETELWHVDPQVLEGLYSQIERWEKKTAQDPDPFGEGEQDQPGEEPVRSPVRERPWPELIGVFGQHVPPEGELTYDQDRKIVTSRNTPSLQFWIRHIFEQEAIGMSRERTLGKK